MWVVVCRKETGWIFQDGFNDMIIMGDLFGVFLTEFRQPLQVQIHLEMPGILLQLGHIQRT